MADDQRDPSVSELIGRLSFVSSRAPAIYLNELLAREMFIAQRGAIASFVRQAAKGASGGGALKLPGVIDVTVGARTDTSQQVTYDITDPLTRALVLHSALGGITALAATTTSQPGSFAEAIGPLYLPPEAPAAPPSARDAIRTIDAEKAEWDASRDPEDTQTTYRSLLILDERRPVGAIINKQWLRKDWLMQYRTQPQVVFGIMTQVIHDLPILHLIYMRPYL